MLIILFILLGLPILPFLLMDIYYIYFRIVLLCHGELCITKQLQPVKNENELFALLIPMFNNHKSVISGVCKTIAEFRSQRKVLPLDVIIIDSSTDGSEEKVLKALNLEWTERNSDQIIARDKNLTLIHLINRNGGKAWAINQIAKKLNTKYFGVLDSDWILSFEPLCKAIQYLNIHPDKVYAQIKWHANNKRMTIVSMLDQISIDYRHELENQVRSWRDIPVTIHGSAFVIKTLNFNEMGGFRENVLSEDVDLATRLMLVGQFGQGLSDIYMQQPPCDHQKQFFWQKWRWIEGRSQLFREYFKPICQNHHMNLWQRISWTFYLGYFGRFIAFTCLALLALFSLLFNYPSAFYLASFWIANILTIRLVGNLLTSVIHKNNQIKLWTRIIEPFSFYGFGMIYSYAICIGLVRKQGKWRMFECKNNG